MTNGFHKPAKPAAQQPTTTAKPPHKPEAQKARTGQGERKR